MVKKAKIEPSLIGSILEKFEYINRKGQKETKYENRLISNP